MSEYQNVKYEDLDFLNPKVRGKYKYANSNSSEYVSWLCMLQRCFNTKNIAYKDYGGRGIIVCERWLGKEGFNNFCIDMGFKPSLEYSLDRINNDWGYSPDNCRWATQKEQVRNTRKARKLDLNGEVKSVVEWCEIYNVNYSLVSSRIKRGWDYKKAIFTPSKVGKELLCGDVFNDWTLIKKIDYDYQCKCICGNLSIIGKFELVNNISTKCRSCANSISTANRYKGKV